MYRTVSWTLEGEGEGGMNWESSTEAAHAAPSIEELSLTVQELWVQIFL